MTPELFAIRPRARFVDGLTENIQTYFESETGVRYDITAIEESLRIWIEQRFDRMLAELGEVITSPHLAESAEFRRILDAQVGREAAGVPSVDDVVDEAETIFNGKRPFSPERLGAMISHIARSGHEIYRTNLNKLLFYADLTNYVLHGRGISGATYVNLPYGPVPERIDDLVASMSDAGTIVLDPSVGPTSNARRITAGAFNPSIDLTPDEIATIDWVLNEYGGLTSSAISEISHQEKAYASTRRGEPIAYEYAKFLHKLPPKGGQ